MSSRLPIWIVLVGILFTLQLSWWGVLLWNHGQRARESEYQVLNLRRSMAAAEWEGRIAGGEDAAEVWRELAPVYQDIVLVPGEDDGVLQIAGGALGRLDSTLKSHRAMLLAEGGFFLVIMSSALWLLLRTARHEHQLALQQSNFLHAVTHEFRSPLQSLRLAIESLIRRPDPQRAPKYAAGMLEDLHRLDSLVENVLTTGRVEAQAFDAHPRVVDLAAAVRDELQRIPQVQGGEPGWLEIDLPESLLAEADPAALHAILHNLLDNARKYGEGKPVMLSLARSGAYAVLSVRDSGSGFRAEDRPRLFRRFWRAGDERVRTQQGTGLGLYLVAELARAQGATTDARSDGPGTGAEFFVKWPAADRQA